jgi:hypothetical protein
MITLTILITIYTLIGWYFNYKNKCIDYDSILGLTTLYFSAFIIALLIYLCIIYLP